MVFGKTIKIDTQGFSDIINITHYVEETIHDSKAANGIVSVTAIGSTASITTIEFEPALVADMKELLNTLIPETIHSRHSETWGDDNGFSHMRATLMGPGITLPFQNSKLLTGIWQQIVIIDHDNRPRTREIRIQVVGE